MIRYIVFNEKGDGLVVAVTDRYPSEELRVLCEINKADPNSFNHLWDIIQSRQEVMKVTCSESVENKSVAFKTFVTENSDYVIEYDTSQINKLISMFTLIKTWMEFHGCYEFDLRGLY